MRRSASLEDNLPGRSVISIGTGDDSISQATQSDVRAKLTADPDPVDPDSFSPGPTVRASFPVILKLSGQNYTAWKTVIPSILDSQEYALAATNGNLIPPEQVVTAAEKLQQRKYAAGNRAARCILFSSIERALAVALFSHNSATVEAPEIWRDINGRFNSTNGGLKQLAIAKLMQFKYQQNKAASENLFRFTQILNRIALLGIVIPDHLKITVLLDSLPISWEPFRQSFTAREDAARSFIRSQSRMKP